MQQNNEPDGSQKVTLFSLAERFKNNEIKHKGMDKKPNTIKTYKTTLEHLKEFVKKEKDYSKGLEFEDINLDFYYKFVAFLKGMKLGQNAVSKDVSILKVFMNEWIVVANELSQKITEAKRNYSRLVELEKEVNDFLNK